jgi:hypothetical protein
MGTKGTKVFTKHFDKYVCNGDTITGSVDGFDLTATIYRDDSGDAPDEHSDCFWPSLDPDDAGYIGPKTAKQLARAKYKANRIMDRWRNDEWWYVGVVVTVEKNEIELTGKYNHALWGIECNLSVRGNRYLRDVANELAEEALDDAKRTLAKLVESEVAQ